MEFVSPRFQGNDTLEDCLNDRDTLRQGSQGEPVRLVQQALIDLGFPIPAGATGGFFDQTSSAVVSYKTARQIFPNDPVVGPKTMGFLDRDIVAFDGGNQPPVPPPPPEALTSLTFWINAFIPHPAMTPHVLPAPGASTGKSMIVVPSNVPSTPIPVIRLFLGDNRGFSADASASSRIHSRVVIQGLDGDTPTLQIVEHVCGESHEIDGTSGEIIQSGTAPTDRILFSNLRGNSTVDPEGGIIIDSDSPRFVQLDYEAAANLPLAQFTPDIDMVGVLQIDRDARTFRFRGAVDGFPAFEAYVSFNLGPPHMVFQVTPIAPIELVGDVKRKVDATVPIVT